MMLLSKRTTILLVTLTAPILLAAGALALTSPSTQMAILQKISGCHLSGTTIEVVSDPMPTALNWSIADWKANASAVARVTISDIDARRFATRDGVPPAPPKPGEDGLDSDEGTILAPIVLDYMQGYKGADVDGYVVARFGGTTPSCLGYTSVFDELLIGRVGNTGIAFLEEPPADWLTDPPLWFTHVQAKAKQLNDEGSTYKPMILTNWYLYNGSQAQSSAVFEETVAVATLEQALE